MMKCMIALTLVVFWSLVAEGKPRKIPTTETFLIQSTVHQDEDGNFLSSVIDGFSDSVSHYNEEIVPESTQFCYIGYSRNVCKIIKKAAVGRQTAFQKGDTKDTIAIESCELKVLKGKLVVAAAYTLSVPKGAELKLKRTIGRCE